MANSVSITFLTLAAGALGYCFYFDYQRRNSQEFRKNIYLKNKEAEKAEKLAKNASKVKLTKILKEKLAASLASDPLTTENKEQTFITEIGLAEKLSAIVGKEVDAAIHFYRGLSVYPEPAALLTIYQKSVPADIYDLIVALTAILPPSNIAAALNQTE